MRKLAIQQKFHSSFSFGFLWLQIMITLLTAPAGCCHNVCRANQVNQCQPTLSVLRQLPRLLSGNSELLEVSLADTQTAGAGPARWSFPPHGPRINDDPSVTINKQHSNFATFHFMYALISYYFFKFFRGILKVHREGFKRKLMFKKSEGEKVQ